MVLLAAEAPPWWGAPLIAGIFTLVGVGIAQLFSYFSQRRRSMQVEAERLRSRAERWDDDIRDGSVDLATRLWELCEAAEYKRSTGTKGQIAFFGIGASIEYIMAVCPKELYDAAKVMLNSCEKLAVTGPCSDEEWNTLRASFDSALAAFIDTLRSHFGLVALEAMIPRLHVEESTIQRLIVRP
jgi:hypothetical protein